MSAHPDLRTPRDVLGFLACGACVAVIAWMVLAPTHFAATLGALAAALFGLLP